MAHFKIVRDEIKEEGFEGWIKVTTTGWATTNADLTVDVDFESVSVEASDDDGNPIPISSEMAEDISSRVRESISFSMEADPDDIVDERPWKGFRF